MVGSRGRCVVAIVCLASLPACPGVRVRVPPAATPVLVSTGLRVTGASGGNATIGRLTPYCNSDFTANAGPYGRGLYVTVRMPTLNHPELSFAGIAGHYWGELTDPAEQSLSQGPRPITQQQVQDLAGRYVGYFIHDDELVGSDYHVTLGVLLGRGVPDRGTLEIRAVNQDPQNTGTQARSNPLEIAITAPVALTASLSPTPGTETKALTINWSATNADSVDITGRGVTGATGLPVTGSRTITLACVGDQDSAQTSYVVRAMRSNCSAGRVAERNLPLTVLSGRKIDRFEGVPRFPLENSSFALHWDAPRATSVSITGPGASESSTQSQGQATVTAPGIPHGSCLQAQNHRFDITATWPGSCGPRTGNTLVTVTAAVATFQFKESGGAQCRDSNRCLAQGRSESEARDCARCAIQQGCSWELVR